MPNELSQNFESRDPDESFHRREYAGAAIGSLAASDQLDCQEVELQPDELLLEDIRDALRDSRIRTTARPSRQTVEEYQALAASAQAIFQERTDREVKSDQLSLFALATVRYAAYEAKHSRPIPDEQTKTLVVVRYAEDAEIMQAMGVKTAYKLAQFQRPAVAAEVQAMCQDNPDIFYPSSANEILKAYTRQPVERVQGIISRYRKLIDEVLPECEIRFQQKTKWPTTYIKKLATFNEDDMTTAVHNWFESRKTLASIYGSDISDANIDKMMFEDNTRQQALALAAIEAAPAQRNELQLRQGHDHMASLRAARLTYNTASTSGIIGIDLGRHIKAHPQIFAELEIEPGQLASYIYSEVRAYNKHCSAETKIATDVKTLMSIAAAYTEDARQLAACTTQRIALSLARSMSFSQYNDLMDHYRDLTGLADFTLHETMMRSRSDPVQGLRAAAESQQALSQEFGDQLTKTDRAKILSNANRNTVEALQIARAYIESFPLVFAEYKKQYPWLPKHLAKDVFLASRQPAEDLSALAANAGWALKTWPSTLHLTPIGCLTLLWRNRSQPPEAVFKAYFERRDHMQQQCRQHGLQLPDEYLAFWAVKSPKADAVGKHIATCLEFKRSLEHSGDEPVNDKVLSMLAFKWPDKSKAGQRATLYIRNRQQLRDDTEFNNYAENWLVDEAAVASSVRLARSGLEWRISLHQRAARAIQRGTNTPAEGSDINEGLERQADSKLEGAYRQQDTASLIDTIFEPLQAEAVKLVFGLSDYTNEQELAAQLGVDDLEAYVYQELLPIMQSKITAA